MSQAQFAQNTNRKIQQRGTKSPWRRLETFPVKTSISTTRKITITIKYVIILLFVVLLIFFIVIYLHFLLNIFAKNTRRLYNQHNNQHAEHNCVRHLGRNIGFSKDFNNPQ